MWHKKSPAMYTVGDFLLGLLLFGFLLVKILAYAQLRVK